MRRGLFTYSNRDCVIVLSRNGMQKSVKFETESYLSYVNIKKFRDAFARFRLRNCALNAYLPSNEEDVTTNCPFCDSVEDERHFLLHCKMYDDLRDRFILKHLQGFNYNGIAYLVNGRDVTKTRDVAMYIYYAYRLRGDKISNTS